MTKFEQPSFSTPANSKKFRDNWDRIFGPKKEDEKPCEDDPDEVGSTHEDDANTTSTEDK